MKSVAQTVIEADRFYTIAAKTGSVIQAVENAKDGGSIRLGKYGHAPEQEWAFVREGDGVYRIRTRASGKLIATGREQKAGGKLVFCDSEIRDETGKLITTGHTVMYFTGKQLA